MRRNIVWSTGLALALASSVLLPLLGHKPLTDWDEGIYAEVSREMLQHGWLVPHWNGQLWFEKPPLMLWITAAFFRVFGVTEFWARAGSALSGVATVTLLHASMARRGGLLSAWIGTVALLGTTGFLHVCRAGEMDALLSLGCVAALLGLTALCDGRPRGWYGFWAGLAVAAMTKGAASVVILLTAGLLAVVERWRWRFERHFWAGFAAFTALVLPWHLAMWRWFGPVFLREYFGFHVLARATRAIEGHQTPWWFYGGVLLVSAMPWVLVFPAAAWRGWQRSETRVWQVFIAVVVVFFSLVRTRLPHYVAPVYPALAVVVATYLASGAERLRRLSPGRIAALAAAWAFIWAGSLALTSSARKRLHQATGGAGWTTVQEREAIGLLRGLDDGAPQPLLTWWTESSRSVATCVFYSRSVVRQVEPEVAQSVMRERYTFDPTPLRDLAGAQPLPILLDKSLLASLPDDFIYHRLRAGPTLELGTIQRRGAGSPNGTDTR